MREKYVRSFYNHSQHGICLPLADNDPLLYYQGPVLVIDEQNRSNRMLFTCLKDWEDTFLYLGKVSYKNKHKDLKALYKRKSYRIAYYKWEPNKDLCNLPLKRKL
jgi:hypothetical protein